MTRLQIGILAAACGLAAWGQAADAVTIRTIAALEQTVPVAQIAKREKQERSLMPEGLAAGLSVREFASLLDYLEQLSKAAK